MVVRRLKAIIYRSYTITSTASSMEFIVLSALLIRPRNVLQLIFIELVATSFCMSYGEWRVGGRGERVRGERGG